jgi:hypothetical protein
MMRKGEQTSLQKDKYLGQPGLVIVESCCQGAFRDGKVPPKREMMKYL